jgi:hypothetical protein
MAEVKSHDPGTPSALMAWKFWASAGPSGSREKTNGSHKASGLVGGVVIEAITWFLAREEFRRTFGVDPTAWIRLPDPVSGSRTGGSC